MDETNPQNQMSEADTLKLQLLNERSRRVNLEVQNAQLNADLAQARAIGMQHEIRAQATAHEKVLTERYALGTEDRIDVPTGAIIRTPRPAKLTPVPAPTPDETRKQTTETKAVVEDSVPRAKGYVHEEFR